MFSRWTGLSSKAPVTRQVSSPVSPTSSHMDRKFLFNRGDKPYARPLEETVLDKKKKITYDPVDRCHEVLRRIYPINKSGGKQIIIGCDPLEDYNPVILLKKPGTRGVKLQHEASVRFIDCFEKFTEFFKADADPQNKILRLTDSATVEFGYHYNKKAIFVRVDGSEPNGQLLIMNCYTWQFMRTIMPLIVHTFGLLSKYSAELKKMSDVMKVHLATHFKLSDPQEVGRAEQYLSEMKTDDINFEPDEKGEALSTLDYYACFCEIKRFCIHSLTSQ
ncbi:uncharacterized protein LOC135945123 [Cloeon dipterum]|uniref:uncharacterized protein LOC135945123 n=1 Tax=Cloeon dipterum TaxID=197152 RepID=UPI0032209605